MSFQTSADGKHACLCVAVGWGSACPALHTLTSSLHHLAATSTSVPMPNSNKLFLLPAADTVERRVSTVGRVHPHLEAKVIDPGNGKIVPHGTVRKKD